MKKRERVFELLVAFSTDDGKHLNKDHAGMAKYFYVYKFSEAKQELVERRENVEFKGDESMKHGDPRKAKATSAALEKVNVVVGRRFGPNLPRLLKKFLRVIARVDRIDEAIQTMRDNIDIVMEEYNRGPDRKHLVVTPGRFMSID